MKNTRILEDKMPEEVFSEINNVHGWWSDAQNLTTITQTNV